MDKEKHTDAEKLKEHLLQKVQMLEDSLLNVDEILERKVVGLGNSGKIAIPLKHVGKMARVFIQKTKKEEGEI